MEWKQWWKEVIIFITILQISTQTYSSILVFLFFLGNIKQIEYFFKKISFFMTWKVPQTENYSIAGWKADTHSLTLNQFLLSLQRVK